MTIPPASAAAVPRSAIRPREVAAPSTTIAFTPRARRLFREPAATGAPVAGSATAQIWDGSLAGFADAAPASRALAATQAVNVRAALTFELSTQAPMRRIPRSSGPGRAPQVQSLRGHHPARPVLVPRERGRDGRGVDDRARIGPDARLALVARGCRRRHACACSGGRCAGPGADARAAQRTTTRRGRPAARLRA